MDDRLTASGRLVKYNGASIAWSVAPSLDFYNALEVRALARFEDKRRGLIEVIPFGFDEKIATDKAISALKEWVDEQHSN